MTNLMRLALESKVISDSDIRITEANVKDFISFIEKEKKSNSHSGDIDDLVYIEPYILKEGKFPGFYWFVKVRNEIVGYAATFENNPTALSHLYVSPKYRRHGLAKILVNWLEISFLYVLRNNAEVIKFYQSLGFVEDKKNSNSGQLAMKRDKIPSGFEHYAK